MLALTLAGLAGAGLATYLIVLLAKSKAPLALKLLGGWGLATAGVLALLLAGAGIFGMALGSGEHRGWGGGGGGVPDGVAAGERAPGPGLAAPASSEGEDTGVGLASSALDDVTAPSDGVSEDVAVSDAPSVSADPAASAATPTTPRRGGLAGALVE